MNYKIIENFLDESDFLNLKSFLFNQDTPWYYINAAVNPEDCPYFTHNFFNRDRISSPAFDLVQPLLEKLNYSSIIQIRANLLLKEHNPIQQGWHIDQDYKNFKNCIFYINECNGPTIIKDTMTKIYPKENKALIMEGSAEHTVISQTDTKRRVVININYYEKY